jgi:hypothetical protein
MNLTPDQQLKLEGLLSDLWHDGSETIDDMNAAETVVNSTIMRKEDFVKIAKELLTSPIAAELHSINDVYDNLQESALLHAIMQCFLRLNQENRMFVYNDLSQRLFKWQHLPSSSGEAVKMISVEEHNNTIQKIADSIDSDYCFAESSQHNTYDSVYDNIIKFKSKGGK